MSTFNRTYRAPKFFLCIHTTDEYHIELEKAENRHSYYSFICRGTGILHILNISYIFLVILHILSISSNLLVYLTYS